MAKLFLLVLIIVLLVLFISQLRNYLARDKKVDELKEVKLEGDLLDIDKKIAKEKARQQDVSSEIENINTQTKIDK